MLCVMVPSPLSVLADAAQALWWQSPALFGAPVGALIAILGVLVNNWQTGRRERAKMQHEAREAERKRIVGLKEKHYLTALATIRMYGARMGRIADTPFENLPKEFGNDDLLATFAALEIVAPLNVTLASRDSAMYFAVTVQALMAERVRVQTLWDSFHSLLKSRTLQGQAEAKHAWEEAACALRQRCMEAAMELQRKTGPFVLAMREELGTPVDRDKYLEMTAQGTGNLATAHGEFLDTLRQTVGK